MASLAEPGVSLCGKARGLEEERRRWKEGEEGRRNVFLSVPSASMRADAISCLSNCKHFPLTHDAMDSRNVAKKCWMPAKQ